MNITEIEYVIFKEEKKWQSGTAWTDEKKKTRNDRMNKYSEDKKGKIGKKIKK